MTIKKEYHFRDITENNPSIKEITTWYKMSGLPLKKFFNTVRSTQYDFI